MLPVGMSYDEYGSLYEFDDAEWFWPEVEIEIAAHLLEVENMKHFTPELGAR